MNSLIPKPANPDSSTSVPSVEVSILTSAQFRQLADVPPAIEWFANIDNPQTRRAYENDFISRKILGALRAHMYWPGAKL